MGFAWLCSSLSRSYSRIALTQGICIVWWVQYTGEALRVFFNWLNQKDQSPIFKPLFWILKSKCAHGCVRFKWDWLYIQLFSHISENVLIHMNNKSTCFKMFKLVDKRRYLIKCANSQLYLALPKRVKIHQCRRRQCVAKASGNEHMCANRWLRFFIFRISFYLGVTCKTPRLCVWLWHRSRAVTWYHSDNTSILHQAWWWIVQYFQYPVILYISNMWNVF